jgi:hypothetical protein
VPISYHINRKQAYHPKSDREKIAPAILTQPLTRPFFISVSEIPPKEDRASDTCHNAAVEENQISAT